MTVPKGESPYIYGMHDRGGEHLLLVDGQARGWVLVTEEIRADPHNRSSSNYSDLAERGYGVIVRLNHAYGSDGTIPLPNKYRDFAERAANFVAHSSGAHIWIIGNEMNLEREQPRQPGTNRAEPITPRLYVTCYRMCRNAIHRLPGHRDDQVLIGAIGPWNGETPYPADPEGEYPANRIPGAPGGYPYHGFFGDYVKYLRDILVAIGPHNCDGIAIHAYTHGHNPKLVFSDQKMGPPFDQYNYHFRTYRDQMEAIPRAFRHLPVYLTEMNQDETWEDANKGWVKNAYQEINDWNQAGHQQIRAAVLYRWPRHDKWHIDGKRGVQDDIREAVAKSYQWDQTMTASSIEITEVQPPVAPTTPAVATPRAPYRTRYTTHNTPTAVAPGQTINVALTVQNTGALTWTRSSPNPFQLGFQWYNAAGQMVTFPPQLDFHTPLPADVPPDATVTLQARLRAPEAPGNYLLRWDMIHEGITWFTSQGDQGLLVPPIKVAAAGAVEISGPAPTSPSTTAPATTLAQVQDVSASLPRHPAQTYPTRPLSAITKIIINHTATPAGVSVQRVAEFQVNNRNLPGITYHFCVTADGQVFQTQPLEVAANHSGNFSGESVGVCLIGNFTDAPPPQPQLDAAAALLAQLAVQLRLSTSQIFGYSELVKTASPGATWPTWKGPLIAKVANLMSSGAAAPAPQPTPSTPAAAAAKPIEHYLLFWHRGPGNWARWDLLGAFAYLERFPVTIGFSVEEAKAAKFVTIVGGPGGVSAEAERILRAAGCQVERIAGATEPETRQMLEQLAGQGKRFRTLA
jgi:hypothetical protein